MGAETVLQEIVSEISEAEKFPATSSLHLTAALSLSEKVLEQEPGFETALYYKAFALSSLGSYLESNDILFTIHDSLSFPVLNMTGFNFHMIGDQNTAKNYLEEALPYASVKKERAVLSTNLGRVFLAFGATEQGMVYLDEAVQAFPRDYKFLRNRGVAYLHLDNLELAHTDLEKAVRIQRHSPLLCVYFGDSLFSLDNDKAIQQYKKALTLLATAGDTLTPDNLLARDKALTGLRELTDLTADATTE